MPRTKKSSTLNTLARQEKKLILQIRNWIILIVVVLLIGLGIYALSHLGSVTEISSVVLPCYADQDVTPFGDSILYYDSASIHCLNATGGVRWSLPVGANAHFSVSDTHIVVWSGSRLFIVDKEGRPSYNETQLAEVQFARIGSKYCAAVIGDDTKPTLIVRALDGTSVDEETEAYNNLMLLDAGFFGEADQYMWTLAMDIYGTAINTKLNTFQVGKMNTGVVSLGEFLAYKVLYENSKLHVFTTQQMYTYDYKAVQDMSNTRLVYGWYYLDSYVPERGDAYILLAPNAKRTSTQTMTELRLLTGSVDRRYTLPSACLGAAIQGKNLYAISRDYLYRADVGKQSFYGYPLKLSRDSQVTDFFGLTSNSRAVVACGDVVYSISLPK